MSFKIKNSEGIAIPINSLDKTVALFWGKEVRPKSYAEPHSTPTIAEEAKLTISQRIDGGGINWFDSVGYQIHCLEGTGDRDWNQVLAEYASTWDKSVIDISKEKYHQPYLNLIQHFRDLKYIPVTM